MRKFMLGGVAAILTLASFGVVADDKSPQPTTSPTNGREGVLIQNIGFPDDSRGSKKIAILNKDASRYNAARKTMKSAISAIIKLDRDVKKSGSASKTQVNELNKQLGQVVKSAKQINAMAGAVTKGAGGFINTNLLVVGDIKGESGEFANTARLLRDLDSQLGLLEPVVYR